MGEALRALATLRLRQMLRAGLSSGRPALGFKGQGRPALLLLFLLYFGWRLYQFGAAWVSSQTLFTRSAVLVLIQPTLIALSSAAAVMMLIYAFTALMGRFLDGRDLGLLLVAPVPAELVFGERILMTSLGFSGVLLIAVPALFAIGSGLGLAIWYYLAVMIGILIMPLAPTSVSALVLLSLLRWLPPARARSISLLVSLAPILLFVFVSRSVARAGALPAFPAWLPTTWPARAITAVGTGNASSALTYALLSIGIAALVFSAATLLAARVLGSGVVAYGEVRRRGAQRTAGRHTHTRESVASRGTRPAWWPVFVKDWLSLRRDSQRQILFLYPLVLVGINAYQILSRPRAVDHDVAVATTLSLLILASLLLVNTTTPGIVNWEGRGLVLLALAPVSPSQIVLSKWTVAALPPLVMVEIALMALSVYLGLPLGEAVELALTLGALTVALAGTTLSINMAWPKLDATNPRRPASFIAGIISLVSDAVISAGTGMMLFLSLYVWTGARAEAGIIALLLALCVIIVAAYRLGPWSLSRLMRGGSLVHGG